VKLSQLRVRMWHQGYTPSDAWHCTNPTPAHELEVSRDGGSTWVEGPWDKTIGEMAQWTLEEGIEIKVEGRVGQKNGRGGWRGLYELSFHRNGGSPPAAPLVREEDPPEPLYVQEGYSNAVQAWIGKALEARQPVSVPHVGEVKSHGQDPVHEAMRRAGRSI